MFVPVNIKLPAAASGMLIAPVLAVMVPELLRVVFTTRVLEPMASVPAVTVSVVAVVVPVDALRVAAAPLSVSVV